jgi:hypothetical protein
MISLSEQAGAEPIDTCNKFLVVGCASGGVIAVGLPEHPCFESKDVPAFAAWLLAISGRPKEEFDWCYAAITK